MPDVKVSIDVASELALVEDSANPPGLFPGDTTITGGVIFLNAASGAATVQVEPPEGYTHCSIAPSHVMGNEADITVYPLSISVVDFFCDRDRRRNQQRL